jgi:hypothetical protein
MSTYREAGCDVLRIPDDPQIIERALVHRFMPIIYFAPGERFFPVDLRSTIRASALWFADPQAHPPAAQCEKQFGAIAPTVDLPTKTKNHFTTVAGFATTPKQVPPAAPFQMPVPLLDEVYRKYADGVVGAELTIYATVCNAHDVPNAHLFRNVKAASKEVGLALQEGLIINYYLYFPACESLELQSEGDWSGISLLIPHRPSQPEQLTDPAQLQPFLPVVAAYYRKTLDGAPPSPDFVAANGGFRRWQDVRKEPDQADGLETHPVVYVSQGRHNCYYQPMQGPFKVKFGSPWYGTADRIETGGYTAGPTENKLTGDYPDDPSVNIPIEIIFPWMFFFHMCATGCQYPVSFDTSGIPLPDYMDGNETTASAEVPGDKTVPAPAGAPYPPGGRWPGGGPPPRTFALKLEYVDLTNAEMAALWRYAGAWGAATNVSAGEAWPSDPNTPVDVREWGDFRGVRRPALGSWFLWNLFWDSQFGCGGNASLTPEP